MKKIKKGRIVWFWYSAGHCYPVTFVRWCKTKMSNGGEDNDKIGVGAIVKSDWLFKVHGGTRTQTTLAPYIKIYRTEKSVRCRRNEIKRPVLKNI